ncbi:hypothetical protein GF354_00120 [Candidatus Peregrinibacteria bacterium]|nr:hypothetical protein [Candidatus Peregrinibacteria bacterium]
MYKNKLVILGLSLISIAFLSLNTGEQIDKTFVKNFYTPKINLDSKAVSSVSFPVDPYATADVFISEEYNPGFTFTSVGSTWDEYSPSGTAIEIEMQFKSNNKWSEWISLDEELEKENGDNAKKYSFASSAPSESFRYKVLMFGDGKKTPIIENANFTAISASKTINATKPPMPAYASSVIGTTLTHLTLNVSNKNIVSRLNWGANESLRYYTGDSNTEPQLISLPDNFYEEYKEELTLSKVVKEDSKGNKYTWPLQYPTKVRKIIIHHTATTKNLNDPEQALRDIYYYHTVSKGWGDIGYNYLIDKNGKIYEGRYGGEGVIGAHSGPGNNGSIGIAVLGDFENNTVPDKMFGSLTDLVAEKAKLHGLNPNGSSLFRGKQMPNIFGHKDIMNTSCPGANLYSKLSALRKMAAEKASTITEKKKFVIDYDYIDRSDVHFLDINTGETEEITIKMENIGKVDWNSKTFIVVNQNPAFDGVLLFPSKQGAVLAKMNESLVKPGDIASFTFTIKAGSQNDQVYMKIAPLVNGTKKIEDYKVLPVNVSRGDFKYDFVSMDDLPKAMEGNTETSIKVKIKNTGSSTWRKSGQNTVYLGTDHPQDNVSMLSNPRSTRIGYLLEDEVKQGEIGTFNINIKTPGISGYYRQYFTPVVEGITWMQDSGMYFETTVYGDAYASDLVSKTPSNKWERGERYVIWIKLRNIGQEVWKKEDLSVHVLREHDLIVKNAQMMSDEVAPGEVAKILFIVKVATDEDLEQKSIQIKPKINGNSIVTRPVYFRYTVIENDQIALQQELEKLAKTIETTEQNFSTESESLMASSNSVGNDIRVKLSFSGNPEITSAGNFEVYSGTSKIKSLNKGESAKISYTSGKYKVETPGQTLYKTAPIRVVPTGNGIIQLKNYENRPAWNPSLNDNEYRGLLEIRMDDGKLITINELPLEHYLRGLGEVSNSEFYEKIKAIMVAARSYAKFYTDIDQKFPGKPYHLNDDPDVCQKYIGYGFEKRAPVISSAISATAGEVVTYKNVLVKTPYFNQSDGTKTKSAASVWNWDAQYLVSVSDSYCDGSYFNGHGVGLSGCGAAGMAEAGYTYDYILKHYYTGVEIKKAY